MRRRVSFRTVLLWVMGVGLLGFVCAAGLAVVFDRLLAPALTGAHLAVGRAVSLHPDQAQ